MTRFWILLAATVFVAHGFAHGADASSAEISFRRDIAPVLIARCQSCHDAKGAKGGYRVDTFESVIRAEGKKGAVVVAGKPEASKLFQLLVTKDADDRMPQKADAMPAVEIARFEKWIKSGARFDGADPRLPLAEILAPVEHPAAPAAYATALPVTALAFSPDGAELAVSGYREVTIWNPTTGALVRRIGNVAPRTVALAFSPDGKTLAVAGGQPGESGELRLFNPATGALQRLLFATSDMVLDVKFSGDGKLIAAACVDGSIRIFSASDGRKKLQIENHADWVTSIAFSPDGSHIASASRDKSSKVFDTASGEIVSNYSGHGGLVAAVAFSADGKTVFSTGMDKKIHVWQALDAAQSRKQSDAKKQSEITGVAKDTVRLVVSEGSLFSCAGDGAIRQHSISDRKEIRSFAGLGDWAYCVAPHAGTKRVAAGAFDGRVCVWNSENGKLTANFIAAPGLVSAKR